ncbi:MAG: T9SS type A sorting domain-containing protein, partial [Bacteroidota bacterium]
VSNNSVNPMMIQSVYSTITSPGGQVFSLTSENYYKVFATPWGEIYFTLNPPTTLLPGASMTISSRLSFIFCDDDPLNPTNIEPGDYQVYTYVSGIGGNGAPFTITLDYTFHVTVFGGGPPPSLRLSNPNADNITEMSWSPNPSQDVASFQFELAEASAVQIDLLDLQGKLVDRKAMVESLEAGTHTIKWNVADLPAGVYFARIKTAREERTVKWIKL